MSKWYIGNEFSGGSVYHFGILGQKWGVRRYQNSDGSLTAEGKERYYVKKDKHGREKIHKRIGAKKYINDDGTLTKKGLERYSQIATKYKNLGYSKAEITKKLRYAINADVGLHRLTNMYGASGAIGTVGGIAAAIASGNPALIAPIVGQGVGMGLSWYKVHKQNYSNLYS